MPVITTAPSVEANIRQLELDRSELIKRQTAMTEILRTESRDFRAEEKTAFDQLKDDTELLTERIDTLKRNSLVEDGVNAFRRAIDPSVSPRGSETNKYSRFVLSLRDYDDLRAEQRYGASETRAVSSAAGSAGVVLPVQYFNEFYDRLRAQSVFLKSGPRLIPMKGISLRLPKITASVTVGTRDELTQIPESTPSFDYVELKPVNFGTLSYIANEVLQDEGGDLVFRQISDDMVKQAATKVDADFFNGAGGTGPRNMTGLFNLTGTQNVAAGGALSLDHVLTAIGKLESAGANPDRIALFFTANSWISLRKLKDGQGRYMIQPDVTSIAEKRLFDAIASSSANLPAGKAVAVDLDQVVVGIGQDVTLSYSDQVRFDYNETAARLTARLDLGVMNAQAVCTITGITE